MENFYTMTIVEMREYAKKQKVALPQNASKREVLRLILPAKLKSMIMMDIKNIVYNNHIHLPACKNKDELINATLDSFFSIYTRENYSVLFYVALDNFRQHQSSSQKKSALDSWWIEEFQKKNEKVINSVAVPADMRSDNKYATTILSRPEHIKNYLLHLIHLETEIDFLTKHLLQLQEYSWYADTDLDSVKKICQEYIDHKTKYEIYDLEGKLELLEDMKKNPLHYLSDQATLINGDGVKIANPNLTVLSKPKKPTEPVAPKTVQPKAPTPPLYGKPTLFNRKKVLEENERLKQKYDAEVSKYNLSLKKYQDEQQAYRNAREKYNADFAAYQKKLQEYNNKIKEQKELANEFNKAAELGTEQFLAKIKKEIPDIKAQINNIRQKNEREFEEVLQSMPEQMLCDFLSNEQKKARKELKETISARNKLYSYNVVFEKYRQLAILPTLYEYIDSGRCFDLRGGDGAYNLYESELRANIIFNKLDNITMSLEAIKANQFMLYTELNQVNKNLNVINTGIHNVVNSLTKISKTISKMDSKLSAINETVESIEQSTQSLARNSAIAAQNAAITAQNSRVTAYNTQVAAYNSAITAQYSRINASRLDSIEFMMSFM